jgi:hypothetical protein
MAGTSCLGFYRGSCKGLPGKKELTGRHRFVLSGSVGRLLSITQEKFFHIYFFSLSGIMIFRKIQERNIWITRKNLAAAAQAAF